MLSFRLFVISFYPVRKMKKTLLILSFLIALIKPVFCQQLNIDSIIKVVVARNPRKANNFTTNNDSLYKRLPFSKPGAQRVKLITDLFSYGIYAELKQNIDMGYKILAWTKAHHDLIAEAVISADMGTIFVENGDKGTALQLQTVAMAAAKQSNDAQALGIVYQEAFSDADFSDRQLKYYVLQGLKFSKAAKDTLTIGWGYGNLAVYYNAAKKPDLLLSVTHFSICDSNCTISSSIFCAFMLDQFGVIKESLSAIKQQYECITNNQPSKKSFGWDNQKLIKT